MPYTIRLTTRPGEEVTVSDREYADLLELGLVFGEAEPAAPSPADVAVEALVEDETSLTSVALRAAFVTPAAVRRGLLDPVTSARRAVGPRKIMATPPTITVGAANAVATDTGKHYQSSTIPSASRPNSQVTDALAGPFRYTGGDPWYGASGSMSNEYVTPANTFPAEGGRRCPLFVDFDTDAPAFEWQTRGVAGHEWRLVVDGELAFADANTSIAATGSRYYIRVDFGGVRKMRRFRLELSQSTAFGGVHVTAADTVHRPSIPLGPKVIVLGDSFTGGSGAVTSFQGWAYAAAERLGWNHVEASGSGGTGYLNPSSGSGSSKVKFRDRLTVDVTSRNPDVIVIAGGINDGGYPSADLETEAAALYDQARAEAPDAVLIVVSNFTNSDTGSTPVAVRDALKNAALAPDRADLFVDTIAGTWFTPDGSTGPANGYWITGTGRSGAPAGNGNADVYIGGTTGSDAVHPTPAGHVYLGDRVAAAVAAAFLR